jgi:hypothetical protein
VVRIDLVECEQRDRAEGSLVNHDILNSVTLECLNHEELIAALGNRHIS